MAPTVSIALRDWIAVVGSRTAYRPFAGIDRLAIAESREVIANVSETLGQGGARLYHPRGRGAVRGRAGPILTIPEVRQAYLGDRFS